MTQLACHDPVSLPDSNSECLLDSSALGQALNVQSLRTTDPRYFVPAQQNRFVVQSQLGPVRYNRNDLVDTLLECRPVQ